MKVTIETEGGTCIDLVDKVEEAESSYYVLFGQIEQLVRRAEELGMHGISKASAQLLIREGLLHKR